VTQQATSTLSHSNLLLIIKNQTPNLNTLPPLRPLRRQRINKRRMRRQPRNPLLPIPPLLPLTPAIKTLDKHDLLRRHILDIIKLVALPRRNPVRLALDFIPLGRRERLRIRQHFLAPIIVHAVFSIPQRVEQVDLDQVGFVLCGGGSPVDDC